MDQRTECNVSAGEGGDQKFRPLAINYPLLFYIQCS